MRSASRRMAATLVVALVGLMPVGVSAQSDVKPDVTGKWLFSVTTDAGTGTPTVTLKQQGDSLTGHYSSQTLGEADLKGTLKDGKIMLRFAVSAQGTDLTVTYTGTVDTKD